MNNVAGRGTTEKTNVHRAGPRLKQNVVRVVLRKETGSWQLAAGPV